MGVVIAEHAEAATADGGRLGGDPRVPGRCADVENDDQPHEPRQNDRGRRGVPRAQHRGREPGKGEDGVRSDAEELLLGGLRAVRDALRGCLSVCAGIRRDRRSTLEGSFQADQYADAEGIGHPGDDLRRQSHVRNVAQGRWVVNGWQVASGGVASGGMASGRVCDSVPFNRSWRLERERNDRRKSLSAFVAALVGRAEEESVDANGDANGRPVSEHEPCSSLPPGVDGKQSLPGAMPRGKPIPRTTLQIFPPLGASPSLRT